MRGGGWEREEQSKQIEVAEIRCTKPEYQEHTNVFEIKSGKTRETPITGEGHHECL
jgi:hypothetical protein